MVKALTEILNGNIKISSGKGTTILLSLPEINIDTDNLDDDTIIFDEELF